MSNIAILGHPTRGKEVIQLLEMLGADRLGYKDTFVGFYYYIECDVIVSSDECPIDAIVFTLEEFEEEFPYKVGDKVYNIIHNENQTITKVAWDFQEDEIVYQINNNDYLFVNYLQPYKEETMEENRDEPKAPILFNRYDYAEGKCGYVIPDGYEFDYIKEGFQTEIILKPKKPQYPKNYEECCGVLGYEPDEDEISCYQGHLIESFVKLLICRDAYWKIAGEQMGLGKPWEPDYDSGVNKYGIISMNGAVQKSNPTTNWERHLNKVLDFPTAEMRNEFYDNFKDLIEQCKELL